ISKAIEAIHQAKLKREFMLAFAKDPVNFVNRWVASQSRDLETILGGARTGVEEMRHSEFYRRPWVEEAVFHHLQGRSRHDHDKSD
ncbi:SWI/SNF complex component snf12, partial [Cladochytrium tenue]